MTFHAGALLRTNGASLLEADLAGSEYEVVDAYQSAVSCRVAHMLFFERRRCSPLIANCRSWREPPGLKESFVWHGLSLYSN